LLTLALCAIVGTNAYAQGGAATSSLAGVVTDTSGAVIPGATITVKNDATATEFTAVSNEQGAFTVPAIDPGGYTVTVTLQGFKTAVLNNVRVTAAVPATVKVALEVGGVEETIQVSAGSEIVQTQSAAVATTLDANQILKLPTGSRSALTFVTSLPGVNTPGGDRQSTINGLPQSTINITIDGMSAQDNYLKTTDGFFARVSPRLDSVEEVTVSTAAQGAAATGQGAVQINFTTRSGTNRFAGSGYFYFQHYKLDSNSWFNNRDLPADPATGKAPKPEDVLYQPGVRMGGPIVIPGLFNGRDKAFFFFNYEESRSPGQNTANRTILHPRAEQGWFRYTVSGQTREVNLLQLAAQNGHMSTIDPIIGRVLSDIRGVLGQGGLIDLTDPLQQRFTYQFDSEGLTRYPTGRVDVNLSSKHRLTGVFNYNDLLSTPDTTNDQEPVFPGFPGMGVQDSLRYTVSGSLRSTLTPNLVNELRIGGTGGRTLFSPERAVSQFSGHPLGDMGGWFLDVNGDFLGIDNWMPGSGNSSREASTKVVDNTLNWIKGSHSVQTGMNYTRGDVWLKQQTYVPTIQFGINANDLAESMFTTGNFPGASNAQLNDARELYAMLTGRITAINGNARLSEQSDEYVYLGESIQRARLHDFGFFLADTWRWKPNLTLNLGLRYELQLPFAPLNNSYSTATMADVCGRSGVSATTGCNLFQPGNQPGGTPVFIEYPKGDGAYDTDLNNFAPNLGIAWTPGRKPGFLGSILGEEGDSVLRAGYSVAYNRPGMSDFTGAIDDNPGIALTTDRNHTLGNLGSPGSVLLRNLNPSNVAPSFPQTRVYPMTDTVDGDVRIFDSQLQVPYAQTWTAGWQRKLTTNMAVEARYVGSRADQEWIEFNYNEVNIVENGFLNEFRLAQANLEANIAAGRGNTFRYFGPGTGTAPLPIFLAYFSGVPAAQAADASRYTSSNFASGTFVNPLAKFNPQPITSANALDADLQRRQNALTAGLPANFLVANPDLLGGAEITGNGGGSRYNGAVLELRQRLSRGLQFQASYTFGKGDLLSRYGFRRGWRRLADTGDEGNVVHAFKANWVYELPFGQGRRFGGNVNAWTDAIIGGWEFDGIARLQSGRLVDFGNVRLVGMTADELRDNFKLRFDDAGRVIYMLPQDIIDNTVRAFDVSATSPTGYGARGAPTGRYMAPANGPDCIELAQTGGTTGYGDCGVNSLVMTGPRQVRFDLSAVKRVRIVNNMSYEFRAEFLNAFNHPWFTPVATASNNPDNYRVTGAVSGRTIQLVNRFSW
jgi:hypothetical protein